jgi:hypothetical protein
LPLVVVDACGVAGGGAAIPPGNGAENVAIAREDCIVLNVGDARRPPGSVWSLQQAQ